MLSFPPDATFVVQFVSFFILLALLNRWLFVPFLQLFAERRERSEGRLKAAADDRGRAEELTAQVDSELSAARSAATVKAEEIRARTRVEERRIFAEAEDRAGATLAELREGIAREQREAAATLEAQSGELAARMIDRLLEGAVRN